ncbi:putative MFS family arabinose efflux permease [Paraburkholderia silvatlantica]|uniref:Putative MFS family arabinose efflux permease n=1 Tax=Paraburkholderia silvatlantica TaxID=321895 RepID=A0A2V4U921_9BURK|nr:MFS transporter [Paraburkholderia silvatlantica]PYE20422.1 putative MFS family arabinose efflux permease [Paraburkholderia silvatlantica]
MNDRSPNLAPAPLAETTLRQWLSVFAVAISAFAFVTSEFLPVGLLTEIARDLGVTAGTAGLMVTTPGVMAAFFAPGLMMFAGRMDRRKVFLLLTAMLLASNIVSALSTHFALMLVGRAMLGAALGGFWTLATAAAGRLVHTSDAARATAIILTGVTCATVIGVPLGTFIAGLASWRMSFLVTGGLVALALIAQALLVPSLPSAAALRLADFVTLLRRPHVRLSMLMVALVFGAHFSTYTFISPLLQQDFSMGAITLLLLAFGVIGFFSNALTSAFVATRLKSAVATMTALLLCALSAMILLDHARIGEIAAMLMWGVAFGAIPLCFSVWIQRGTADQAEAGSAMFVSVIQVAIALGSSVGGAIVDRAGIRADLMLGCVLAVSGLVTLQRLAAMERPARVAALDCECSPSLD